MQESLSSEPHNSEVSSYYGYKAGNNSSAADTLFTAIYYINKWHLVDPGEQEVLQQCFADMGALSEDSNGPLDSSMWKKYVYGIVAGADGVYTEGDAMDVHRIIGNHLRKSSLFTFSFQLPCFSDDTTYGKPLLHCDFRLGQFTSVDSIETKLSEYKERQIEEYSCERCGRYCGRKFSFFTFDQELVKPVNTNYPKVLVLNVSSDEERIEAADRVADKVIKLDNEEYRLAAAIYFNPDKHHYNAILYDDKFKTFVYDGSKNSGRLHESSDNDEARFQMNEYRLDTCLYIRSTVLIEGKKDNCSTVEKASDEASVLDDSTVNNQLLRDDPLYASLNSRGIVEEKDPMIIDPADYWSYISDNSIDDASYLVLRDCNVKPLSTLSVSEVGQLMESLHFEEYKESFLKNRIDGRCLMKCDSTEKVANMGMSIIVKASIFLDMITKIKSTRGIPEQCLVGYGRLTKVSSNVVSSLLTTTDDKSNISVDDKSVIPSDGKSAIPSGDKSPIIIADSLNTPMKTATTDVKSPSSDQLSTPAMALSPTFVKGTILAKVLTDADSSEVN